ncbi:unnamed protein product [Adineta steineri]|uniref:Uncharacterized protein n=1 Tax=Adineta steineri TaxID=433720 RepID=A0A813X0F0_9BILA|nr:unnamed protein product [Adineta steineri]
MLKFAVSVLFFGAIFLLTNTNGFFLHTTPKCQVAVYKGGKDFGGEKIMANKTFVPYLKTVGQVAKACKVKVFVTESYKQLKTPNEFVLSTELPLALGHAIRFNLQDPKGGTVCNKLCMTARSWKTIPEATCFINGVTKKGIHFKEPDLIYDEKVTKLSAADAEAAKVGTQKLCAPKVKPDKKG